MLEKTFCVLFSAIIFILVCFFLCIVQTFNLDDNKPLIKLGETGSYFGYSVAQHKVIDNGIVTPWILVGAPLGNNLQPGTNRSGAFYRCPLTTSSTDCKQIITDGNTNRGNELSPPNKNEIKNGQWLGSTVSSGSNDVYGGKVVVCAHRYAIMVNEDVVIAKGLCYLFSQDFDDVETIEPCLGRRHVDGYTEYGFCQAGTSSIISGDTLMVGAPGPLTWTGMAFLYTNINDIFHKDLETRVEGEPRDEQYSYRGMSVTNGYFVGKSIMSYATGAPRANENGSVLISIEKPNIVILDVVQVLHGEQFGSGFGYSLLKADVNGDGLDDLLVGAPYFYMNDKGGAVYVYINSEIDKIPQKYSQRLLGPRTESRFGISLTSVGDLNKDGFEDIAVGAPEDGNGGAVYIFMGSKNGLREKPSQIIRAGPGTPLKGAYNKDSVVLLRSRPVIDITTELRQESEMNNIRFDVKGCDADPHADLTCFSFEICTLIKGKSNNVFLKHHLIAEVFQQYVFNSRALFKISDSSTSDIIYETHGSQNCVKHTLYLDEDITDKLNPIKFQLSYELINKNNEKTENFGLPSLNPILNDRENQFLFEANFHKNCGPDNICKCDLNIMPRLLLKKNEYIIEDNSDILLHVQITNEKEPAHQPKLFIMHPNTLYYVSSKVRQSSNVKCSPFNSTLVTCRLPNPFKNSHKELDILFRFETTNQNVLSELNQWKFIIFANSTSEEFFKREPKELVANIKKLSNILISTISKPENVFYSGSVKGEAAIKTVDEVGSEVEHIYEIYNDGPSTSDNLEININWPHQLENNKEKGKWLLYLTEKPFLDTPEKGSCEIMDGTENPLNLQNKNKLKIRSSESDTTQNTPDRIKREIENESESPAQTAALKTKNDKNNILSCEGKNTTAKCIKIVCKIRPLHVRNKAIITIKAHLWNATFIEEFKKRETINIVSFAKLESTDNVVFDATFKEAITKVSPDLLEQYESSSIFWVLIGSIIIGLIVLLLVMIGLWRCGFFKRQRPDPTYCANIQKEENKPFL